jgi:hypothetical protein
MTENRPQTGYESYSWTYGVRAIERAPQRTDTIFVGCVTPAGGDA